YELVIPLLGSRAEVEAYQALAVQVVARPMSAVVVARRRLDGQVHETQLLVDRHLRPHTGISSVFRRAVQPAVVSLFSLLRNRMEGPEPLARANVEPTNVAFIVLEPLRRGSFAERRADDDHVSPDDRCALEPDLAGDEVGKDGLIDVHLEIDRAFHAEGRD